MRRGKNRKEESSSIWISPAWASEAATLEEAKSSNLQEKKWVTKKLMLFKSVSDLVATWDHQGILVFRDADLQRPWTFQLFIASSHQLIPFSHLLPLPFFKIEVKLIYNVVLVSGV